MNRSVDRLIEKHLQRLTPEERSSVNFYQTQLHAEIKREIKRLNDSTTTDDA